MIISYYKYEKNKPSMEEDETNAMIVNNKNKYFLIFTQLLCSPFNRIQMLLLCGDRCYRSIFIAKFVQ